ncbi:hypothetical protein [Streptomyces aurantiogriseus]|uniref:Uncharacterized protein n=1 Tax=Streptomyces aurantiogriseus TaxID=66870 RepID=A0A918FL30_9ACTN|nr:hypothetical protein [Streptomyces aurantiogriseus]GGR48692.1 hypothetical protein GCM10010251_77140 [Streptomyces aurantiogriseus]
MLAEHPVRPVEILHPGQVVPDTDLAGAHITVSLDRLHIADHPGPGIHHVLLNSPEAEAA